MNELEDNSTIRLVYKEYNRGRQGWIQDFSREGASQANITVATIKLENNCVNACIRILLTTIIQICFEIKCIVAY